MKKIYLLLIVLCFSTSIHALDSLSVSEGVIIDKENEVFYLMSGDKSLLALQSSGESLWQLPMSAMPLFIEGDYLVSMKDASKHGVLSLVVMRKKSGDVVSHLEVELPKAVIARIDEGYNKKFDIDYRYDNGHTYLVWSYIHKRVGGVFRGVDDNRIIDKADGSFKIEFDNANAKLSASTSDVYEKLKTSFVIPKRLKNNWENRVIVTEPVVFGEKYHSIGYDSGRAVIKTFNTSDGSASDRIKLEQPLGHLYKISADKEKVFTPKRLLNIPFYRYEWLVHDMLDGSKIGSVKSPFSSGDYHVATNNIYYIQGLWKRRVEGGKVLSQAKSLIGYDFSMDKQLWSVEIRDTNYYGVTPP